jgi:hypothetical protein
MSYILSSYKPTEVIVKRSDDDGRTWVAHKQTHDNEFWVGNTRVYDTIEDCVRGETDTILSGIKQLEYEIEKKQQQVDAMKQLLKVA